MKKDFETIAKKCPLVVQSSNRTYNEMLAERMAAEDALTAEVARLMALLQAAQGETGEQLSALQRENEQLQSRATSVRV